MIQSLVIRVRRSVLAREVEPVPVGNWAVSSFLLAVGAGMACRLPVTLSMVRRVASRCVR